MSEMGDLASPASRQEFQGYGISASKKARNSEDPIVRIAANWEFSVRNWDKLRIAREAQPAEQSDSIEVSTPAEETTVRDDNKESENEIWKIRLHGKCEGKDLKNFSTDFAKISNTWVLGLPYNVKMKGHEFVQSVQVRGNSLATPERRHSGRQSNRICTRCGSGATAGLSHILQQCAATQLLRSSRHN